MDASIEVGEIPKWAGRLAMGTLLMIVAALSLYAVSGVTDCHSSSAVHTEQIGALERRADRVETKLDKILEAVGKLKP